MTRLGRRGALSLVAAWLSWACGSSASDVGASPSRPPTPVHVELVEPQPFAPTLVVPGIVEARARIELAFRVGGTLAHYHVEEGDRVEAGGPIAELDRGDLERAVRAARAALARARAAEEQAALAFQRQRRLIELSSTSRKSYDAARLEHERLRAEVREVEVALEEAHDDLERGLLRAPVAGYIERRLLEEHEQAPAGAPAVVLTELDTVRVRSAVPDSAIAAVRVGGSARVRAAAWPGREFEATVRRVDLAADEATRTLPFELELANAELALRPEMVVEVALAVGPGAPVVSLPLSAVLRDADALPFVFLVAEGDRAERRPLRLGPVDGARVLIAAGVSAGDRVVTRGQHYLRAGDRVRVLRGAGERGAP